MAVSASIVTDEMSLLEEDQLKLLERFPYLLPIKKDFTYYEGSIYVGSEEFAGIRLGVPNYPRLCGLWLSCSWTLSHVLEPFRDDLESCVDSCASLSDYLCSMTHLIESRLSTPGISSLLGTTRVIPSALHARLLAALEPLGAGNVARVSAGLDTVVLTAEDGAGRTHQLTLSLRGEQVERIAADLPAKADLKLLTGGSIASYYRAFETRINELQLLWQALDDIDDSCWVVDPEVPNRSQTHRRIIIGTNVSVQVTLSPLNGAYRPDIKVQGSPNVIARYTSALAQYNLEDWSFACSAVCNLLDALGLDCFPCRPETQPGAHMQLVQANECAICYVYKTDDNALPDATCENDRCSVAFHQRCLYQWLDALKKPTVYNRIHGDCPNCQSKISCDISTV